MSLEAMVRSVLDPTSIPVPVKVEKIPTIKSTRPRKRVPKRESDMRLSNVRMLIQTHTVDWSEVIGDLVKYGYNKPELSKALGLSHAWANSVHHCNTRKVDYAIGVVLKELHRQQATPERHKRVFG